MLVNSEMDMETLGISVALVFLILIGVAPSGEKIGALGRPVSSASVKTAARLEEILWTNCRLEMIHSKEEYEDPDFSIFKTFGTNIPANGILKEENVQKLMSALYRQISPELFFCIREKVFISPISGDDSSSSERYLGLLESLVSKVPAEMRRYLAGVSEGPSQEVAQSPGPAPSLSSVGLAPQSATSVSALGLAPISASTAASPSAVGVTIGQNSSADINKESNNHKTIVIAVVVTAVVTFIFALLFFVCCRKWLWKRSGNDYKDDRPLLSISMSDYSGSPKSDVFPSNPSYGNYLSEGKQAGSLEGNMDSAFVNASSNRLDKFSVQPSDVKSNGSLLPLKPPPGRRPPSGLPPLMPPPGRAEPLPPEPPASLRPIPVKATSPPPPPAPPPAPSPPPPLPPARKGSAPPPPPIPGIKGGPRPPPLLKTGAPPPCPPSSSVMKDDSDASRAKLKPFFWDKVLTDPDHSMVWHQIKSGSFQFNEEMIESLFGYAAPDKNKPAPPKDSSLDSPSQFIQLIDPKKAQNLSILLRALNVTTEEVCDALDQGNELPPEFLETLLKMAPTPEEELKLRLFGGELSQLGPAERFLKVLGDIPFAFKRMDALSFMCTFDEESTSLRESFTTVEAACKELKNSRLFLKLLEAVLKTGNRMNDGTFRGGAQAFKLDTLLKLSDVKGVDGKTTLLHFVVQQIIRSEGIRAARISRLSKSFSSVKSDDLLDDMEDESEEQLCTLGMQVVSSLGEQLGNVKKAAGVDGDTLTGSIAKLRASYNKARNFLNSDMKNIDEGNGFRRVLNCFVEEVNTEITSLSEEEKRITDMVKSTADYFHGTAGKEEGLRLFIVVRDFLIMLDKVCAEVRAESHKKSKESSRNQKKDLPSN
ncbi:hypothetical protein V2J09_001483 [Rumex salicifolius]